MIRAALAGALALVLGAAFAADEPESAALELATGREAPAIATNATPREIVTKCREMLPRDVQLKGRIILRTRKGIVQAEYGYDLRRRNNVTELDITDKDGAAVAYEKSGRILQTDVTWSDLTLDYLWWDEFEFDPERESETVHGQVCLVILMKKGERTVRVWVDRKTGAMMQAEEVRDGKAVRRLWGTRIKKFGDRWAPNVLEVETVGSGHRTKITIEELNS